MPYIISGLALIISATSLYAVIKMSRYISYLEETYFEKNEIEE